jgi:hypothetical protein|uniref:Uncharacterized protein n=1 Tax=viral metagenome TaxID=1070528 RepID=A0A6C0LVR2_9ZZZZ|tara:strand:+ start:10517 stop:10744 length:228 start_codon:yes stop_codon:yes gene_type:complete
MESNMMISSVAAFLFLLFKFVEMRFIDKENKPLKVILKDAIIVFISTFVGMLAIQQFPNVSDEGQAAVFTNSPDF